MKARLIFKITMVVAFILTVISLITHNDIILIITAILMAYCVILTFIKKHKFQCIGLKDK